LGDGRLIRRQRLLELLHASRAGRQALEDADAKRVGERLEKLRLEGLELAEVRHAEDYIYEYIDIQIKPEVARRSAMTGSRRCRWEPDRTSSSRSRRGWSWCSRPTSS